MVGLNYTLKERARRGIESAVDSDKQLIRSCEVTFTEGQAIVTHVNGDTSDNSENFHKCKVESV